MKYMKYLWMSACALLLVTVTACSDYEIFAEDLNPAKVTDDGSGDSEEEDNWDGTFEEGAVLPFTRTNRAVTASFTNVFFSAEVKAIERQGVLVSWRWLPDDADDITFDVYRNGIKLNETPISKSTNYKDLTAEIGQNYTYEVKSSDKSLGTCKITPTDGAAGFYRSIKVKTRADYDINDGAIGDLDGDGEYEIVIKRQVIGQARDVGDTKPWTGLQKGTCLLEAYKLDGSSNGVPMWTIDMGKNISQGQHTTQFLVYDFDGDGKAEIALRTSEGTTFGDGTIIGDVDGDGKTDYRDASSGRVLDGPEFLSLVDGETGVEMTRTEYIPRGEKDTREAYWGDAWGNRSERFLMGVGHFGSQDGRASIVMCRGYYKNFQLWAVHYNSADNKLRTRWKFNTANGYSAQWLDSGNHNLSIGDVDDDGKDEIIYGSCGIDHDGKGMYTTGLGHGDALHLGKFDPNRSGLQIVDCHEHQEYHNGKGVDFRDAATGEVLWYIPGSGDIGRCMVADVDPATPGCEVWSSASATDMYSCKGEKLSKNAPVCKDGKISYNMGIWWSGSLNRQVLDNAMVQSYTDGRLFTGGTNFGVTTINDTKANPCFYGDIWGDWREEMIYTTNDYSELRIFTTDFETQYRIRPLMEDHIYRISAAHQNIGYNQPTHTGFYLGSDRTDYKAFK